MEVYGTAGSAITVGANELRVRYGGDKEESRITATPLAKAHSDSLRYLAGVLREQIDPTGDLSSLETNVTVMQILDAALRSAQTGKTIPITPRPE
jgi:glucose-fructose oxidoreductase